jgi:hypothetical protein
VGEGHEVDLRRDGVAVAAEPAQARVGLVAELDRVVALLVGAGAEDHVRGALVVDLVTAADDDHGGDRHRDGIGARPLRRDDEEDPVGAPDPHDELHVGGDLLPVQRVLERVVDLVDDDADRPEPLVFLGHLAGERAAL